MTQLHSKPTANETAAREDKSKAKAGCPALPPLPEQIEKDLRAPRYPRATVVSGDGDAVHYGEGNVGSFDRGKEVWVERTRDHHLVETYVLGTEHGCSVVTKTDFGSGEHPTMSVKKFDGSRVAAYGAEMERRKEFDEKFEKKK